jgi:hypothetical protein
LLCLLRFAFFKKMLETTKILPVLGIWDKRVVTFVHQNCTFGNREND